MTNDRFYTLLDRSTAKGMTGLAPINESQLAVNGTPFECVAESMTGPLFTAGTNNTPNGTSTMTAPAGATLTAQGLAFINGANETAVTPADAPATYGYFQVVNYIICLEGIFPPRD